MPHQTKWASMKLKWKQPNSNNNGRKKKAKDKGGSGPKQVTVTLPQAQLNAAVKKAVASAPRQPATVRAKPQRTTLDATARRFVNAVADPFRAAPSRGITNASFYTSTCIIRRRVTCVVSLDGTGSGCELFIPQGTTSEPWPIVFRNAQPDWTGASTAVATGYSASASVPVASNARVVSSGVRITPLASYTNTGGVFYHYWQPHGADGGTGNGAPALTLGAAASGGSEAISIVPVRAGATLSFVNPSGISWIPITDATTNFSLLGLGAAPAAGAALPAGIHGTRLYFKGPGTQDFQLEICSNVEFYHDTQRNFSEPSVTHRDGEAITVQVNSTLSQRASNATHVENHGGHGPLSAKLQNLADTITNGGKVVLNSMAVAYHGIKGAKAIKGLINGGKYLGEAAEGAIIALA